MKFRRLSFIVTLSLLVLSGSSSSAEDKPAEQNYMYRTGPLQLTKPADINVIRQNIRMQVGREATTYEISYLLKNDGEGQVLHYGFPMDDGNLAMEHGSDIVSTPETPAGGDSYLHGNKLAISLDGIELQVKTKFEKGTIDPRFPLGAGNIGVIRVWHLCDVRVRKNAIHQLTLTYSVPNSYADAKMKNSPEINYDLRRSMYDFIPSSGYGHGVIENLNIEITALEGTPIDTLISAEGIDGLKRHGNYIYGYYENIDTKSLSHLISGYRLKELYQSRDLTGRRNSIGDIELDASSTLNGNYGLTHLIDGTTETAWVEGKKHNAGIGEWIDITLKDKNLEYIAILNGYVKDKNSYYFNNRIKTIRITVWKDVNTINNVKAWEIELPDRPFQQLDAKNYKKHLDVLFQNGGGGVEVEKVRLEIIDVYKGTKLNDTCISELFIF